MARTGLVQPTVRAAGPDDVEALVRLVGAMRAAVDGPFARGPVDPAVHRVRYLDALADADQRVLAVISADGEVVGTATLVVAPASALVEARSVVMTLVHVEREARRRGAGKALLVAAAQLAEERGIDVVAANVASSSRDAQRFFVRWGFTPVVVRRAVPLGALKRRLGQGALAPPVATVGEAVHTATRRGVRARLETSRAVSTARRRSG